MKKITKVFAFLMIGFSVHTFGQISAAARTSVTVVTPIGITKAVDMAFGNIATTTASGEVVLGPDGTRTPNGGVTLPTSAGTVTAASFAVTGSGSYTYTITLPSSPIVLSGTTDGVTVGAFVSNPAPTGTLSSGTQTVNVGATLIIPASTVADTYKNISGLQVTVNYN
jgi:hypothetical protein